MSDLQRAIDIVGNQSRLAKACGVHPSKLWNWLNRDKKVPAEFVIPVSKATGYRVAPHDLRPDIYPNEKDGLPEKLMRQTA